MFEIIMSVINIFRFFSFYFIMLCVVCRHDIYNANAKAKMCAQTVCAGGY